MKHYHQLTQEQRYGIYTLLKTGQTQTKIAKVLGVHKSTISRELRRNPGKRGYRYQQAHDTTLRRRQDKDNQRIEPGTWFFIEDLIRQEWSPEQIHG